MSKSQNDKILRVLKKGRALTRLSAMLDLGIANLTARIAELREAGHPIVDEWRTQRNRYGDVVKFKQYRWKRGGAKSRALA